MIILFCPREEIETSQELMGMAGALEGQGAEREVEDESGHEIGNPG
jgi:hypothetical protein